MSTDPYKNVTTFQQLLDLNVRYLRGEKIVTPYHFDSVDEETLPLLDRLVRINKAGFLSVEGQPAMKIREHGTFWGNRTPKYTDTLQRSFIVGIVQCHIAARLAAFLRTQPVFFSMNNIKPFFRIASTFPAERLVLTRWRACTVQEDLRNESWKDHTIYHPRKNSDTAIRDFLNFPEKYPRIAGMLERSGVHVVIACPSFGVGSVEDVLLKFFEP